MYVMKKSLPVQAFRLGDQTQLEQQLRQSHRLRQQADGLWRLQTLESPEEGQLVANGDYIKLDTKGMPYPNKADWFEANHIHLEGNRYRQINRVRKAWRSTQPPCPELQFLLDQGLLSWNPADPKRAFSAQLWGTLQTAAEDAVILFDRIETEQGVIRQVDFHFVAWEEFLNTYNILPQEDAAQKRWSAYE